MATEDSGRISVSKDFLKAALLELQVELIKTLATKAEVEDLVKEVEVIKERNSPSREEFDGVKGTLTALKASVSLVALVAAAALPLILRHYIGG